jgi:hypothetical protein
MRIPVLTVTRATVRMAGERASDPAFASWAARGRVISDAHLRAISET